MPLSFSHDRLVIPDCVVARAVDGSTVLLNIDTGSSFLLDEIGTRAWAVLTSSPSLQLAFETLLKEYRVEPTQLRHDLEVLVDSLDAQGLVEVRHG